MSSEMKADGDPETIRVDVPNGCFENPTSVIDEENRAIETHLVNILSGSNSNSENCNDLSNRNETDIFIPNDTDSTDTVISTPSGNSWMSKFSMSWAVVYILLIAFLAVGAVIFSCHVAHLDKKQLRHMLKPSD